MITVGDEWTAPEELSQIRQWARNAKLVVEIGTWTGRSAEAILQGMDDGKTNGMLICVDHFMGAPDSPAYGKWVETEEGRGQIKATWETRTERWRANNRCLLYQMTSEEAARHCVERQFDFIFIDGDHSLPAVSKDIDMWWPLIRPGGFMCGHDYNEVAVACWDKFGKANIKEGPRSLWRVEKSS